MKKISIWGLILAVLLGGSVWWFQSMQSKNPDVISRNGLHWHPVLEIYVKDEKQVIPANIGIGGQYSAFPMGMAPVHTHEDAKDGIVHLEFNGMVRENDIILGKFFESWKKDINFFGSKVKMTVNGIENMEFANYIMRDGDRIELKYE